MEIMEILRPETYDHQMRLFDAQGNAFECTVTLHYCATTTPCEATRHRIGEAFSRLNTMVNIQQLRLNYSREQFESDWPTLRRLALPELERVAHAPADIRFVDLTICVVPTVIQRAAE